MNTIDDIVAEYGTEPINRAVRLFGDALIETGILMRLLHKSRESGKWR